METICVIVSCVRLGEVRSQRAPARSGDGRDNAELAASSHADLGIFSLFWGAMLWIKSAENGPLRNPPLVDFLAVLGQRPLASPN